VFLCFEWIWVVGEVGVVVEVFEVGEVYFGVCCVAIVIVCVNFVNSWLCFVLFVCGGCYCY